MEERCPYPGLSSFTEKDAARFFGREAEVKALWERIRPQAARGDRAVGSGEDVLPARGCRPARPEGWALVCTPGRRPSGASARALVPELAGDAEALGELRRGFDDPRRRLAARSRRWRRPHGEALVVVDQFEELFTLNPGEVQARFAALLGRLACEADVHVAAVAARRLPHALPRARAAGAGLRAS